MIKLLLALFLTTISTNAMAKWVLNISTTNGEEKIYFDDATIKINGDLVKIWELWDYEIPNILSVGSYKSSVDRREYNCKNETSRIIQSTAYEGRMQTGEIIHTLKTTKFEEIMPNTPLSMMFKSVCRAVKK